MEEFYWFASLVFQAQVRKIYTGIRGIFWGKTILISEMVHTLPNEFILRIVEKFRKLQTFLPSFLVSCKKLSWFVYVKTGMISENRKNHKYFETKPVFIKQKH